MRWKLSLAVPFLFLLFLATDVSAQTVPLTVTIPVDLPGGVTKIAFPTILPYQEFRPDTIRVQYLVGSVAPDSTDGRYRFISHVFVGSGGAFWADTASFEAQATCNNGGTEGTIERISCSVLMRGEGLVCSATYDLMDAPPPRCEGTIACVKCPQQVKICGSRPSCN